MTTDDLPTTDGYRWIPLLGHHWLSPVGRPPEEGIAVLCLSGELLIGPWPNPTETKTTADVRAYYDAHPETPCPFRWTS